MSKEMNDSSITNIATDSIDGIIKTGGQETLLKVGTLQNAVFNRANFSSIATDASGVIQIFNVGAEQMLGYAATYLINKVTPAEISDPQEVIARAEELSSALGTTITPGVEALVFKSSRGIEDIYELTYIRKDGSRLPAVVSVTALRNDQDTLIGYLLIGTDNTERKQIEQALRDSEERFKALFTQAPVGIAIIDSLTGRIYNANAKYAAIVGLSIDEMQCIDWMKITHPDDVQADLDNMALMNAGKTNGFTLEKRYIHANGSIVWINLTVAKMSRLEEGRACHHCIVEDITERKQVDQALKRASEKSIALLRNASDGIHILDFDGNILEASDSFCAFLGYQRDEVIGMNVAQWDAFFIGNELLSTLRQQFDKPTGSLFESRHRRKDGSLFDVEVSSLPLVLDGKPALFNSSRDITKRKKNEEKLRLAANVFSHAREGIMITDADGTIIDVNATFCLITGYSRDEVIGNTPRMLSSGRHDHDYYAAMWRDLTKKGHWYGEI
ncbi:MAG: PAS domain S-box protein [Methylococcaceae bacterium]